ncbi:MAG: hypothetical protein JJE04_20085 [Acidobacteriia bacterium]|nr:hypothetical protein [Terriglobia bacterium]
MLHIFRLLALLLAVCLPSAHAQVLLHMHFSTIQRMLASQVFTQDGRKFVKGQSDKQCSFAYLENPVVGSEQGRLRIRARFSGRSAFDLFSKCVGLGDAFDLSILATPQYKTGSVVFKNVMVESYGPDRFYKKQVRRVMAASLERDFRYPLAAEVRRVLEHGELAAGFRRELSDFDVTSIYVAQDSVVLSLRFHLAVK